jgi:hypothetical protein
LRFQVRELGESYLVEVIHLPFHLKCSTAAPIQSSLSLSVKTPSRQIIATTLINTKDIKQFDLNHTCAVIHCVPAEIKSERCATAEAAPAHAYEPKSGK